MGAGFTSGVCACAAAALLLSPSIAGANDLVGVIQIQNGTQLEQKVLDVPGGSKTPATGIVLSQKNDEDSQQWFFHPTGDNPSSFFLINKATGLVLDDPGSSTNDGVQVIQFGLQGGDNQKWFLITVQPPNPNGAPLGPFRIINKHSGKALDVQGGSHSPRTPIIQNQSSGTAWSIVNP